jgi:hypothetical protein
VAIIQKRASGTAAARSAYSSGCLGSVSRLTQRKPSAGASVGAAVSANESICSTCPTRGARVPPAQAFEREVGVVRGREDDAPAPQPRPDRGDAEHARGASQDLDLGIGAGQGPSDGRELAHGARAAGRARMIHERDRQVRIEYRLRDRMHDVGHVHPVARQAARQQPGLALGAAAVLDGRVVQAAR